MTASKVQPERDENGVPMCVETCPSHDGKRCEVLGRRPGHICEPAVVTLVDRQRRKSEEWYSDKYGNTLSLKVYGDRLSIEIKSDDDRVMCLFSPLQTLKLSQALTRWVLEELEGQWEAE